MDRAYLKVRNFQETGNGCSSDTSRSGYSAAHNSRQLLAAVSNRSNQGIAQITNPIYTENLKAYTQLSQTLSNMHA